MSQTWLQLSQILKESKLSTESLWLWRLPLKIEASCTDDELIDFWPFSISPCFSVCTSNIESRMSTYLGKMTVPNLTQMCAKFMSGFTMRKYWWFSGVIQRSAAPDWLAAPPNGAIISKARPQQLPFNPFFFFFSPKTFNIPLLSFVYIIFSAYFVSLYLLFSFYFLCSLIKIRLYSFHLCVFSSAQRNLVFHPPILSVWLCYSWSVCHYIPPGCCSFRQTVPIWHIVLSSL